MSWTLLDSGVAGFADGNSGHVYSFPGGSASAGDLLVLAVSSDTVVSTPSGWSVATSDVHNIGAYLFHTVASGGETSVTVTTSGNFSTEIGFLRYGGGTSTPLDVVAKAFNTVSTNTTPSVTTDMLAGSGELVVAAACLGGMGGGTPNTPTWSAGYTNRLDGQTSGTGTTDQHLFVADRYDGSGAESPNVSWTSNANNQTVLVAAFLSAAGATDKSDSDAGTGVETTGLTATVAGSDSASAVEAADLSAATTASDEATGTDTADIAAAVTATDSGSTTDSAAVSADQVAADAGVGVEDVATTATLTAADIGSATDAEVLTAGFAATDQATAVEAAAVGLLAADTATATETALLLAALAAADTAHGTETAVLSIVGGSTDITVTASPPTRGWTVGEPARAWSAGEPHT